ncbi:MAG: biopolymer transporter TolR, partial [Acidobacteriota bacterium]|nr:biopolymer transporter TolR [Acidobacteriota bacterium]
MVRRRLSGHVQSLWTIAILAIVLTAAAAAVSDQGTPIGPFDGHGDVGSPKIAGSATYNAVSQELALAAGGVNMWAQRDEFQFVWKRMTGDFILQARVQFLGQGTEPHRK